MFMHICIDNHRKISDSFKDIFRDPNDGTPLWQVSHTIPISLGILMGVIWNSMGNLP